MQTDYFERKLDDKRRLTIPAELRAEFASGVVLTRGFGKYLHLYPQQVWDREVEGALTGSILDERVADLNVKPSHRIRIMLGLQFQLLSKRMTPMR